MSKFWDQHYKDFSENTPSPFAVWVTESQLSSQDEVVEIGCGNGRDGLYISRFVSNYTGIDLSPSAVQNAKQRLLLAQPKNSKTDFQQRDFSTFEFSTESSQRLVVYSRFSLHSDDEEAEDRLLSHLESIKRRELLVLIEVRTIFDELFGIGESVGNNAYVTDHYRRFIDPGVFRKKIEGMFKVSFFEMSDSFAPYKNERPKVLRIAFENFFKG